MAHKPIVRSGPTYTYEQAIVMAKNVEYYTLDELHAAGFILDLHRDYHGWRAASDAITKHSHETWDAHQAYVERNLEAPHPPPEGLRYLRGRTWDEATGEYR